MPKSSKILQLMGKLGGGLPSGGAPHQMLVTDAEGKTVWEDKLCYESSPVETVLIENAVNEWPKAGVPGVEFDKDLGSFVVGQTYKVVCTAFLYGETNTYEGMVTAESEYELIVPISDLELHIGSTMATFGSSYSYVGSIDLSLYAYTPGIKQLDEAFIPDSCKTPTVTADDAGKFLRVNSNGQWAAESVPNAEEASF